MRKNDIFVTRLASGAMVSAMAACLIPQIHTEGAPTPVVAHESTFAEQTIMPEQGTQEGTDNAFFVPIGQVPSEWEKQMEREFRKLAMEEARGTLNTEQTKRLEQLNRWRDQLLCPQPAAEILLQIKRDRLLARTKELLNAYVEFQAATNKTRAVT